MNRFQKELDDAKEQIKIVQQKIDELEELRKVACKASENIMTVKEYEDLKFRIHALKGCKIGLHECVRYLTYYEEDYHGTGQFDYKLGGSSNRVDKQ